ncbi:hypothetical protein ACFSQ3_11230 [Sphingobacterium corticis]|uniref:SMODS-associating 2TM beta-strand rich effector domain-containing protein n=1 Tax=Sphingobacterium corticis TaxID=1812823 RepID=A0ABW5NK76_9SPHI
MRKNNPNRSNAIVIVLAVLLTILFCGLAQPFGNFLIDEYNIDPTLFVNTNGWAIYILLLVFALLLYRVLQSQAATQREQTNLNKLQAYHIRSQYLGNIELTNDHQNGTSELAKFKRLPFKIVGNSAFDMSITCDWNHSLSEEYFIQATKNGYESRLGKWQADTKLELELAEDLDQSIEEAGRKSADQDGSDSQQNVGFYQVVFNFADQFGLRYKKVFILSYSFTEKKFYHTASQTEFL